MTLINKFSIMDIFGFKNQGINYDKFRPKYPPAFYQSILKGLKHKHRYLDIATGTGQLLFAICHQFQFSKGIDISQTMINGAQESLIKHLKQYPDDKVILDKIDVMNLEEKGYDLITVGQALHFFPIQKSMQKIKTMLNSGGLFVTFGYVPNRFESDKPHENDYFYEYYKLVKPHFTFDRDDLHTFYSDKEKYPFQTIFKTVQREKIEVKIQMNKEEYLSYLKTMSGYNLYLQKTGDDPIVRLSEKCADQIDCIFDYFRITCSND